MTRHLSSALGVPLVPIDESRVVGRPVVIAVVEDGVVLVRLLRLHVNVDRRVASTTGPGAVSRVSYDSITDASYNWNDLCGLLDRPEPGQMDVALEKVTQREIDVLQMIAEGMADSEVAAQLSIAESTVGSHVRNLREKLGAKNRAHLVLQALKSGLIG